MYIIFFKGAQLPDKSTFPQISVWKKFKQLKVKIWAKLTKKIK